MSATRTDSEPPRRRILVVDDDAEICELLVSLLGQLGYQVDATTDAQECSALMHRREYACVLVDLELGRGQSGLALCARIADSRPDIPVVIVTGHAHTEAAVGALRAGACDFITKPVSGEQLEIVVSRARAHKELTDRVTRLQLELNEMSPMADFIGSSAPMRSVFSVIRRVAATDFAVLVTGESGTGKELAARAVHGHSGRAGGPFVAVNCAAVPANLLESELFGHAKGAFTDARTSHTGLFVQASGGTLFLDEIGDMSADLQAKLLRVLQERTVRPVGGNEEIDVDTRIIAATNRDLDAEVEAGRFRDDLFYRLNVVRVPLPPLRTRGTDILTLAHHFLAQSRSSGEVLQPISPEAERALLDYAWPGNIRELQNAIEYAVAMSRSRQLQLGDLPASVRDYRCTRINSIEDKDNLPTLEEFTRRYIRRVLDAVDGNKTHASRVLGMDRRTLYRRLERLDSSR